MSSVGETNLSDPFVDAPIIPAPQDAMSRRRSPRKARGRDNSLRDVIPEQDILEDDPGRSSRAPKSKAGSASSRSRRRQQDSSPSRYSSSLSLRSAPPTLATLATRSTSVRAKEASDISSSRTSKSRLSNPIKLPADLLKLSRPVEWVFQDSGALWDAMAAIGGQDLLGRVLSKTKRRGYLPVELRPILDRVLHLMDEDSSEFAAPAPPPLSSHLPTASPLFEYLCTTDLEQLGISPSQADPHTLALVAELGALRRIVASSAEFVSTPRSKAAWNETIHGPMLDLATSLSPLVAKENVTRATIAAPFRPRVHATTAPADAKMIDYALLLRPAPHSELASRLSRFVDRLEDLRSFAQTTYPPLMLCPAGMFVETQVDDRGSGEGQTQLGTWLASWLDRVSVFPRARPPRFLPLLLVVRDSWELWFACDAETTVDGDGGPKKQKGVCVRGPLKVGGTWALDAAYQLLVVLRLLVRWMEDDFQMWVQEVLSASESVET